MKIQNITFSLPHSSGIVNKTPKNKPVYEQNNTLPPAYADFNVSFGAQINRTPANFYAFNKKNLPDAMKTYLDGDYEDRQNMPPAQMMRYVYRDLNEKNINSLDFVRRLYADKEPLFAELTDTPTIKARKGLVSQVETLKEEFEEIPLFKDGSSNLGLYLLRKIYLDGKQRKEINEDFYKDLSKEYEGLITEPVDYSTFKAYGIKFPKVPFWNSFVVTRDDWNYVYKPRKTEASVLSNGAKREVTLADILSGNVAPSVKPPKFKIEKRKVERMTDAILNGHGDSNVTAKLLKRKGLEDNEEISFVSKYLSQIMSVALEKIHASDEMRSFFESYDDLTKSQRKKFESYWRSNPQMRQLQSLAISDTIKLFFEAYGADGNNDEFHGLLTYADSIKPARDLRDMLHNKKQAEYDEMFAELDRVNETEPPSVIETLQEKLEKLSEEELNEILEQQALKTGAQVFRFPSPDGKIYTCVCKVEELFEKYIHDDMRFLPTAFIQRYFKYINNSPLATDEFKNSIALRVETPDFVQEQLIPLDDIRKISTNINSEYYKKYPNSVMACEQAVIEELIKKYPDADAKNISSLMYYGASAIIQHAEVELGLTEWNSAELKELNTIFNDYLTPVTKKEDINKISKMLVDYISNFTFEAENEEVDDTFLNEFKRLLAANLKSYPKAKSMLERVIRQTKYIEQYGGSAKVLLKPEVSDALKNVKLNLMLENFILERSKDLKMFMIMDINNIHKYIHDEEFKRDLMMSSFYLNSR